MSPVPDLDQYPGPSSLFVLSKVLVWHSATETGSSEPYRGEKEQTVSVLVPPISGTAVSHILGISIFMGNLASYVEVGDSRNISSALLDRHPCLGLDLDCRGPVLNVLMEHKSFASFLS